MLHANFWPLAVSSIPQTACAAVSKRTRTGAAKVSSSDFWIAPFAGAESSNVLRKMAGSAALFSAVASSSFALPSMPRRRLSNDDAMRS